MFLSTLHTLLLAFPFLVFSGAPSNGPDSPGPMVSPPDHDLWNQLLQKHVDHLGTVDYRGIKEDMALLDRYLDQLAADAPDENWTRVEKLAYWINAYNAFTVKLVAEHYPLSTIMDLNEGKVWDTRTITLGGVEYTLNDMEHTKLREEIGDARIHFGVNCAALSCPPLHNEAFTQGNVDHLLNERTKAFLTNEAYNDISARRANLSKIFEWYAEDFGDLIPWLNKHLDEKIQPDADITYREYNWELNGLAGN